MRRCPTCNQTFTEAWLSFCTSDGTPLVDSGPLRSEPPPTQFAPPPMPPSVSPAEQPTINLPGTYAPPPVVYAPPPAVPAWQPPPAPNYVPPINKNLATSSMIVGLLSVTIGWLCGGPIMGIVSIVLGIVALSQIKKAPDRLGGSQFAWVGIITGGLSLIGHLIFWIIYIIAMIASAH